jgi:hypothetical protein
VFQNQPLAERSRLGRAAFEIASERGTGNRQVFGTPAPASSMMAMAAFKLGQVVRYV